MNCFHCCDETFSKPRMAIALSKTDTLRIRKQSKNSSNQSMLIIDVRPRSENPRFLEKRKHICYKVGSTPIICRSNQVTMFPIFTNCVLIIIITFTWKPKTTNLSSRFPNKLGKMASTTNVSRIIKIVIVNFFIPRINRINTLISSS